MPLHHFRCAVKFILRVRGGDSEADAARTGRYRRRTDGREKDAVCAAGLGISERLLLITDDDRKDGGIPRKDGNAGL